MEPRLLWEAFRHSDKTGKPAVLLIDEIDKAPRDFPNDLLHELDRMEFTVAETRTKVKSERRIRPLVFITSNSAGTPVSDGIRKEWGLPEDAVCGMDS